MKLLYHQTPQRENSLFAIRPWSLTSQKGEDGRSSDLDNCPVKQKHFTAIPLAWWPRLAWGLTDPTNGQDGAGLLSGELSVPLLFLGMSRNNWLGKQASIRTSEP